MSFIYDVEMILKENQEGFLKDDQALAELRLLVENYDKEEQAHLEKLALEFEAPKKEE